LPQNSVYALVQDRSGFVYAGTEDGVARCDGGNWRVLPLPAPASHAFVSRVLASAAAGSGSAPIAPGCCVTPTVR